MDPCTFIKVSISSLALRVPAASKPTTSRVHSACSPCFCDIKLPNNPVKTLPLPLLSLDSPAPNQIIASTFYLDESSFQKQITTSVLGRKKASNPCLEVVVYTGSRGGTCRFGTEKQLGKFRIEVDAKWMDSSPIEVHNGWVPIGKRKAGELHLNVRVESDPRFVFQFNGQPEVSPQILQLQGKVHQPIFSCKFTRDRGSRARLNQLDPWTHEKDKKDRKGWLILIHDLSGSPVAAASMVTPFVPSAGTDRVSRSNPGAWLILKPGTQGGDSWLPLGRLEAWRERGSKGEIGCNFKVTEERSGFYRIANKILLSKTAISCQKTSKDIVKINMELPVQGGFIMSATTIHSEHKKTGKCSKLQVQLAKRHVTCVEDAAVFMALAAAVDLSVDACQPFSRRFTKDLGLSCASL
ncbi:hypothetical protein SUGI_1135930 [Cryptomeria japonica]|uniref:uncharacterized protein LOC131031378 n=1 Tax=Cryptomeria japonica TaxID=3369 RepID=UPI002414B5E0|nr:uncharacterized protein LOC131031378 [Cryptomeria japonica]XP_057818465.2 uncharacterized protein LOC131031378 [Cryptomeria japonica]GLJ53300.1 hypothetical protein SUGI_1135930 [Cryptomeria japonica]